MGTFIAGFYRGFRRFGLVKWMALIGVAAIFAVSCIHASAVDKAEAEEEESVLEWMIGKVQDEELDIGNEDSIEAAIAEGEEKFDLNLTEEEKKRIVTVLESIDSLGVGAEEMLGQARELYRKYGTEVVQETNDVINHAVEEAVESVKESFFQSLKNSVKGFFKNMFSSGLFFP